MGDEARAFNPRFFLFHFSKEGCAYVNYVPQHHD
jgi:hypothetical protein